MFNKNPIRHYFEEFVNLTLDGRYELTYHLNAKQYKKEDNLCHFFNRQIE